MTDATIETSNPIPFPDRQNGDGDPTVGSPAHVPAAERLRAFEDQHLGKDVVRLHGHVEKGFGSKFKNMPERHHRHYAALEKLVHAEQHLADAHSALIAAEESHQAALTTADKTEAEIDGGE